jgi:rubrerythrin
MKITRRTVIRIMAQGTLLYTLAPLGFARADEQQQATVEALKFLHGVEVSVEKAYLAYAVRAREEGYPGIGNLFRSLALGEEIHAREFKQLLKELGEKDSGTLVEAGIHSTRENLKKAIETELYHIEMVYPESMEQIKDEGHEKVLQFVNFAWQSEKMHRDLLKRMQKATGFWYQLLASRIEKDAALLYICNTCGSSYDKLPVAICLVCEQPVAEFILVEHEKPLRKMKDLS